MDDEKERLTPRCLNCSAPDARLICNGCKAALKIDGTQADKAFYCGLQCQKLHWPSHASICINSRIRRSLYRGAQLAQLLHYKLRETLWSTNIGRIESDEHGGINIFEVEHSGVSFIAFPEALGITGMEKQAVLANLTCRTALIYFHCLISMMFKAEATLLQEVYFVPKPSRVKIITNYLDGGETSNAAYRHSIIKITLQNGEKYALDISGAQYGYLEPLSSWKCYTDTRVQDIEEIKPLGYHRKRSKFLWKPEPGCNGVKTCEEEIAEVINGAIEKWQEANGKLRDMLRLHEDMFIRKRGELFCCIEESLEDNRCMLKEAGMRQFRLEKEPRVKYDVWSGKQTDQPSDSYDKEKPGWEDVTTSGQNVDCGT